MELPKASGVTAADLMTRPAVTIGPYDLVSHAAHLTVTVKDGAVTLAETPENIALGHDIVGEIQRMEGVVTVRDHLAYPDESAAASGRRARLS
jgi:hypothetical protein